MVPGHIMKKSLGRSERQSRNALNLFLGGAAIAVLSSLLLWGWLAAGFTVGVILMVLAIQSELEAFTNETLSRVGFEVLDVDDTVSDTLSRLKD